MFRRYQRVGIRIRQEPFGKETSDPRSVGCAESRRQSSLEYPGFEELFVTLTRKAKEKYSSQEALAIMEDLSAWPVITIDIAAIKTAVSLGDQARISFWDALVVVAASRVREGSVHQRPH